MTDLIFHGCLLVKTNLELQFTVLQYLENKLKRNALTEGKSVAKIFSTFLSI